MSAGAHRSGAAHESRGFSLVEVLVALVVCSIGLLGLAKMESLAMVSTGVASARSIAAIQASSLAATMHANHLYWSSGAAPLVTTVSATIAGVASISDPVLGQSGVSCLVPGPNACGTNPMAAYDVQQWAVAMGALLPGYLATIACNKTSFPINCTIQINWAERAVAANAQQNMAGVQAMTPLYSLYVEP